MNSVNRIEFSEFPILETKRLKLREPIVTDAADFFVFQSDPYVQRYNMSPLKDVSQAEELIERSRAIHSRQDRILWAITLKGQDTVIGSVEFGAWGYHNRVMLGYDLALAYRGRGIGSEAGRVIIRFGFERMGLNRIEAETIEDNLESRRMLEKLGFTCEGIRCGYSLEDDSEYHGSAMYGMLLSEYNPSGKDS
jgi:ribosomal-protein-alanine N-acetyltransferase